MVLMIRKMTGLATEMSVMAAKMRTYTRSDDMRIAQVQKHAAIATLLLMATAFEAASGQVELKVSVQTSPADQALLGQPVELRLSITNVSDHEVTVSDPVSYDISWNNEGREKIWTVSMAAGVDFMPSVDRIGPGQTLYIDHKIENLTETIKPGEWTFKPHLQCDGEYRKEMRRVRDPSTRTGWRGEWVMGRCWKGDVVGEPVQLRIVAPSEANDVAALRVLTDGHAGQVPSHLWYRYPKRYTKVLSEYPDSSYAASCEFALARDAQAAREPDWYSARAAKHYRRVIEEYPTFAWTDDAKVSLAQIYRHRDREKMIALLRDCVKNHPQTESAQQARELLAEANAPRDATK